MSAQQERIARAIAANKAEKEGGVSPAPPSPVCSPCLDADEWEESRVEAPVSKSLNTRAKYTMQAEITAKSEAQINSVTFALKKGGSMAGELHLTSLGEDFLKKLQAMDNGNRRDRKAIPYRIVIEIERMD